MWRAMREHHGACCRNVSGWWQSKDSGDSITTANSGISLNAYIKTMTRHIVTTAGSMVPADDIVNVASDINEHKRWLA